MKDALAGFYQPSEEDFRQLWRHATFVVDANILLNLYRYPDAAREQLLKVLETIKPRLWIPFQVAIDYQQNRLAVISEQKKKFNDVCKILTDTKNRLISELDALQLKKRHSSIQTDTLVNEISERIDTFVSSLSHLEEAQPSVTDADPIRNRLDSLLTGRIGSPPTKQDEVDLIHKEGEARYRYKMPPGYLDAKKEKDIDSSTYMYGGITYERQYGDLILWKQIAVMADKSKSKAVIFVTDDEKEDWWWTIDAQGKKKIGPRPELIEEIGRTAGVRHFWMYNSEQFLKRSREHLKLDVSEELITQVRDVAHTLRPNEEFRQFQRLARLAEEAVHKWLKRRFPNQEIAHSDRAFPDFVVENLDSGKQGYEVKLLRRAHNIAAAVDQKIYRGYYELKEGRFQEITFIIPFLEKIDMLVALEIMEKHQNKIPKGVHILVGLLLPNEDSMSFEPVRDFGSDLLSIFD